MTTTATKPSQSTIKRLFALSGNQCAFPKCTVPIVQGETLVGDVCHIKAASPQGPRYDSAQPAEERHGFANLILMCPNHHRVVDDDDEAYTVERLVKLKAEHEDRMAGTTIDNLENGSHIIFSGSAQSVNQTGGVTAHTINATSFNVGAAHRNAAADARVTEAVDRLWSILVKLKQAFGAVAVLDGVTTRDELEAGFRGEQYNPFLASVERFQSLEGVMNAMTACGIDDADAQRPFVTPRLYSLFYALQAVHARSATLLHFSFEKRKFKSWRDDTGIDQQMEAVMQPSEWKRLKTDANFNLMNLIGTLEATFLAEARKHR